MEPPVERSQKRSTFSCIISDFRASTQKLLAMPAMNVGRIPIGLKNLITQIVLGVFWRPPLHHGAGWLMVMLVTDFLRD